MLTRLWSPAFKKDGEPRPVIYLHAGLNIVEGADEAQNSIGKSTLDAQCEPGAARRKFKI